MQVKSYLNICNLYSSIWILYFSQGILYPNGSIISQILLLINIFIGFYYLLKVNLCDYVPTFYKGLNVFFGLHLVYGIILILNGQPFINADYVNMPPPISYLKAIIISFLPLYAYYYFAKNGLVTEMWIRKYVIVIIVLTTCQYFYFQYQTKTLFELEEITNNNGYEFLAIFPLLVFFRKKPFWQILLLMYCSFFILMSMKRGAIVIASLCIVYFFYSLIKNSTGRTKFIIILLSIIFTCAVIYKVNQMLLTSDYFLQRIEQTRAGDSSSRGMLYSKLLNYYIHDTDLGTILLGSGADATIVICGNYAHQDWLELLINCGIVGIVIYIYFYACMISSCIRINDSMIKTSFFLAMFILFLESLFSMGYQNIGYKMGLAISFCLAINSNKVTV